VLPERGQQLMMRKKAFLEKVSKMNRQQNKEKNQNQNQNQNKPKKLQGDVPNPPTAKNHSKIYF
jgi:hypothetical protein